MHTLIFATNNAHKIEEIQRVVGSHFNIQSLQDAGINIDIPEPHDTLTENALEKANTIFQLTGKHCFSEDTGLEVAALNGAPGVKSARYAGEPANDQANIQKLLHELSGQTNRQAQFRTVIALIIHHQVHYFEGICKGQITHTPQGQQGFGYDPVFIPDGADRCFAFMSIEEKNQYSHRRQATDKLILFLENFSQTSLT
jgi:XTP/dITP diphosphohydrolase